MCGIGSVLWSSSSCLECSTMCKTCHHAASDSLATAYEEQLSEALQRRGGDTSTCQFSLRTKVNGRFQDDQQQEKIAVIETRLLSSVLHLRGENVVPQPLVASLDSDATALRQLGLCWNGECYACNDGHNEAQDQAMLGTDAGKPTNDDGFLLQSDTEFILRKLQREMIRASSTDGNEKHFEQHQCVAKLFSTIQGEYAFILAAQMEGGNSFIYFGRDPLGRRSLLLKRCNIHQERSQQQVSAWCQNEAMPVGESLDFSKEIILLSSVAPDSSGREEDALTPWIEIPPNRIYCVDTTSGALTHIDIPKLSTGTATKISQNLPMKQQIGFAPEDIRDVSPMMMSAAFGLYHHLNAAVRRRVLHVPPRLCQQRTKAPNSSTATSGASVAVLFSGGLDSVVLAALCHDHVPPSDPIDLINVAFYGPSTAERNGEPEGEEASITSPDRAAALMSYHEMTVRFPMRLWNFIAVDVDYSEVMEMEQHILSLIRPLSTHMDFNIGSAMWFASRARGRRITFLPEAPDSLTCQARSESHTMNWKEVRRELAKIIRSDGQKSASQSSMEQLNSPQKAEKRPCTKHGCSRSALSNCVFQSCKFCCSCYQRPISQYLGGSAKVCPAHNFRDFRTNDHGRGKKKKELKTNSAIGHHKQLDTSGYDGPHPSKLSGPSHNDHIDDVRDGPRQNAISDRYDNVVSNSGMAPDKITASALSSAVFSVNMASEAKVLLVGVGADEQMGGYGRHRSIYRRGGYQALRSELNMEMKRLWNRNLGRDDRCISDHGKEARFPFLDEDVVSHLASVDLENICDMNREPGTGDKMILRLIAKMIGMEECSSLVKRAIQFGSRIARVSEVNCFASRKQASGAVHYRGKAG